MYMSMIPGVGLMFLDTFLFKYCGLFRMTNEDLFQVRHGPSFTLMSCDKRDLQDRAVLTPGTNVKQ